MKEIKMANAQIVRDQSKRVKDVCVDFRTREDEALAQKLQDEEFETHYIRNRKERGTARVDVKTAKQTYLEEVKSAGLLRDLEYQRLAADDAWLAIELQQRLDEEEKLQCEHRAAEALQDEEYAQYLQQREKQRLEKARLRRLQNRIEKERQETEKIERERLTGAAAEERRPDSEFRQSNSRVTDHRSTNTISDDNNDLRVTMPENNRHHEITVQQSHRPIASKSNDIHQSELYDVDQHELDEEERNREQEMKDEEYARQLQLREQEKLRKIMEERDRRLAMKIQKKEAEEYRRKRADKELRQTMSMPESQQKDDMAHDNSETGNGQLLECHAHIPDQNSATSNESQHRRFSEQQHNQRQVNRKETGDSSLDCDAASDRKESSSQRSRSGSMPKERRNDQFNSTNNINDQKQGTKSNSQQQLEEIGLNRSEDSQSQSFTNVAAAIDPTYTGEDSEQAAHWTERRWGLDNDDMTKPAPVIQNTKRKKSSVKKSKDKGDKCKQQ